MKKTTTSYLSLIVSGFILTFGAQAQCSFSGLGPSYCSNAGAVTLTPQVPNGLIAGPGVTGNTFVPSVAGPGIHTLTSYGACTGSYQVTQGTYTTWPNTGTPLTLSDDVMSGMNP